MITAFMVIIFINAGCAKFDKLQLEGDKYEMYHSISF